MALHYAPDNASDTVAATRMSGSGTLSVWNGHRFGDAFPIFVAIFRDGSFVTALEISGRSGNDLTVAGPAPGYADDDLVGSVGGGNAGSFLLSGGQIAWVEDYTYVVAPATYMMLGVLKSSAGGTVVLSAPDGTYDRFDAIGLDANGDVAVIEGDPADPALTPDVDPGSFLNLSYALVSTGTTQPVDVVDVPVYLENAGEPNEFTTASSNASIVVNSTNNPRTGTTCIEATSSGNGHYVQFTDNVSFIVSSYDKLVFYIRSKAAWPATKSLTLRLYASSTALGTAVTVAQGTFGFDASNTSTYQPVIIPISAFNVPTGTTGNRLRITVAGSGTNIGFYLDDISLQGSALIDPGVDAATRQRRALRWHAGPAGTRSRGVPGPRTTPASYLIRGCGRPWTVS